MTKVDSAYLKWLRDADISPDTSPLQVALKSKDMIYVTYDIENLEKELFNTLKFCITYKSTLGKAKIFDKNAKFDERLIAYANHNEEGIYEYCKERFGLLDFSDLTLKQLHSFISHLGGLDDDSWLQRFSELEQFKKKKGHCKVSRRVPDHKELGIWVMVQRK